MNHKTNCLLSLILLSILFAPKSVFSCQCWNESLAELVEKADKIFQGTIISVDDNTYTYCIPFENEWREESFTKRTYKFRVRYAFKGQVSKIEDLIGGIGRGDCGIVGRAGDEMIILGKSMFQNKPKNIPENLTIPKLTESTFCYGSGWIDYFGDEEIAFLNKKFNMNYKHPASIRQVLSLGLLLVISIILLLGLFPGPFCL